MHQNALETILVCEISWESPPRALPVDLSSNLSSDTLWAAPFQTVLNCPCMECLQIVKRRSRRHIKIVCVGKLSNNFPLKTHNEYVYATDRFWGCLTTPVPLVPRKNRRGFSLKPPPSDGIEPQPPPHTSPHSTNDSWGRPWIPPKHACHNGCGMRVLFMISKWKILVEACLISFVWSILAVTHTHIMDHVSRLDKETMCLSMSHPWILGDNVFLAIPTLDWHYIASRKHHVGQARAFLSGPQMTNSKLA